ncbi:alpha/beta hydrolase [Pseudoxanthomonas wuyuanensis]
MSRILLVIALLVVLAYGALCAVLYWQQRALIYFPRDTRVAPEQTNFSLSRDGTTLRGWLVHPGKADAILYFGGNGESVEGYRETFAEWFPDASVYLLAYRGYGASDGQPGETALFGDALALYDTVRQRHPGGSIAVIGRSLGSGVASYLASQRPLSRLVLVTPFDSLASVAQAHYPVFPVRWLLHDRYESLRYLPRHQGKLLVMRAGRDEVVPAANTDRLLAGLPGPAQVLEIPEADHNDLSRFPAYREALVGFLRPEAPPLAP